MTDSRKRTDAEAWRALEAAADDADLARVDALSEEALMREVRDARVTPEEAAAIGAELLGALASVPDARVDAGQARGRAAATAGRGRWPIARRVAWIGAPALLAIGAVLVASRGEGPDVGSPPPPHDDGGAGAGDGAAALRDEAYAACARGEWRDCEVKLNAAGVLDPAGESEPRVVGARRAAREGMRSEGGT